MNMCIYCLNTGYVNHGTDKVPCPCGHPSGGTHTHKIDLPGIRWSGATFEAIPAADLLKALMADPKMINTRYLGLGVYRSEPGYILTAQQFTTLCQALGVEYEAPGRFHDSDIGWVK